MKPLMLKHLIPLALMLTMLVGAPVQARQQVETRPQDQAVVRRPIPQGARDRSLRFARTELFFGTAKPDGTVTEEEFRIFLDQEVTPRFPDGLTVVTGDGQFRGADGSIVKEDSFVLILLHPVENWRESNRRIEQIRQLYLTQFQQESVLRVDDPLSVWVSF
ncbi:MAG: DUF3574 domain-containing protein [Vicinamibacteraceae bacterium]